MNMNGSITVLVSGGFTFLTEYLKELLDFKHTHANTLQIIQKELFDEMKSLVLQKNNQYGDSVLDPKRYFSTAPTDEQIKVRIDDKINRLVLGDDSLESDDDIIKDLIGYLTLLLVYRRKK